MELLLNLDMLVEELDSSRAKPSAIRPPDSSGIYAVCLRDGSILPGIAPGVGGTIYVGRSGNLRQREFDTHFADDQTGFSTLRRSLGAILRDQLRLTAVPRSGGESESNVRSYKFDPDGETRLTSWMTENLEVGVCPVSRDHYEEVEKDLIAALEPVLNLTGWHNPVRNEIKRLRKRCADEAAGKAAGKASDEAATEPISIDLFGLLRLREPDLDPVQCKIHLAVSNGTEDPLDVYLAGKFQQWQADQAGKNFKLPYVVSLIKTRQPHIWLFAGLYRSHGCRQEGASGRYRYDLREVESCSGLRGRLLVHFQRTGRSSYLLAEKWAHRMAVAEYRANPMSVREFPGYTNVYIGKPILDIIVSESIESWRSALSSVGGVYLISDPQSGKLYVGSATGAGGIWQRWVEYSKTGHGGNKELRGMLDREGPDHANQLRFSILEIADTHATREDVIAREEHWKQVLMSREFGHN